MAESAVSRSLTLIDRETISEELECIGYADGVACSGRKIHAGFELHVEQGPILEAEQKNPRDDMLAQIDAELRGGIANIAAASKLEA